MERKQTKKTGTAEQAVRNIRRATRRQYSSEEKIRIALEGLRGEDSIAELCRREGINQNLYYRWSKEFLGSGKKRLAGDTAREATSEEVKDLRNESHQLKEALVELMMENRLLKKAFSAMGAKIYEIYRLREVGDHSAGRTIVVADDAHLEAIEHPEINLLQLVQSSSGRWPGCPRRPEALTRPGLEQSAG
jgi:transposase